MKNIINKITIIIFLGLSAGCSDYVEDINTDPNAFLDTTAEVSIQGVMLSNQFWQNGTGARLMMIWMNQATGADRQYVALNNWNSSSAGDFNDQWEGAYVTTISHAQITRQKAIESNNLKIAGVAQVLEAFTLGMVTSIWGDIPYSEVNQREEFPTPKYDSQTSVYQATQALLNEAIANLNEIGEIPGDKDLYYAGDPSKWIALAHALKARFYLHTQDYGSANTEAQLGISSIADDFNAQFGGSYGLNFNPFYSFLVYDRAGYMDATDAYGPKLLDAATPLYRGNMKTDESARYEYVYGSGYDLNAGNLEDGDSAEGKFGSNMPMVTYGEMLLIQAEYETRVNGLTSGLTAYNRHRALLRGGYGMNGDTSGTYEDYVASDFAPGGIENPDGLSPEDALLREILQERYVYFIGHFEAFNDYKRTNNGAEIQLKSGYDGTPQRFIYPQSEINTNPNVPAPLPKVTAPTPINQ